MEWVIALAILAVYQLAAFRLAELLHDWCERRWPSPGFGDEAGAMATFVLLVVVPVVGFISYFGA